MKCLIRRFISFMSKKGHSVYKFLEQNGFFDEIIRGIVKLIFFVIILYYFKQVVW